MTSARYPDPPDIQTAVLQQGQNKFEIQWSGFFRKLVDTLNGKRNPAASGTVSLAKLTTGGTPGSLTVVNGVITAIVEPT